MKASGRHVNPYVQSFGERQNCRATPYLPDGKFVSVRVLFVLKTLAKPEILPPNSSRPAVGGIDNSTFNILPCLNVSSSVWKYRPPGLTLTVRPVWSFCWSEPSLRHDKSNFTANRLCSRFSEVPIIRLRASSCPFFSVNAYGYAKSIPKLGISKYPIFTSSNLCPE